MTYVREYVDSVRKQALDIKDTLLHRFQYGSPILFQPSSDIGLPQGLMRDFRTESIKRRRQLMGLPYQEYVKR